MWSDREPLDLRALREIVPHDPIEGCAWLASGPDGPASFIPTISISYAQGSATICTSEQSVTVEARAFDLLEAMLEAWKGSSDYLVGHLSYDLAAELEDLGSVPRPDFPSMFFFRGRFVDGPLPLPAPIAATVETSTENFQASVRRTVDAIYRGDIFQTNLCRTIRAQIAPRSEAKLFGKMQEVNPASHAAFLQLDADRAILSMSPETYLSVRDGVVESRPIKGTRPHSADPSELQSSEKDRAELAMIVDVVRNDLARVCEPGSVRVTEHASLMTLPTVHHLYSRVEGRLRGSLADLLRASFPAASISGAPKIEAMRIALREEGALRGPCMGAIGWISFDGRMDLSVAIRTAYCDAGKLRYLTGGGITAASDPQAEYEETVHKASALLAALGV